MAERRKIGFGTILMVILAVCVVAYVVSTMRTAGDIPYSELRQYFLEEKVQEFSISDTRITAKLKGGSTVTSDLYDFDLFYQDLNELVQKQYDSGIITAYNYHADHSTNWLQLLLPYVLAFLGFILLMNLMNRMAGGGAGAQDKLSRFGEAKVSTPGEKKVTFQDVAGADEEKEELREIVEFLREPQKYLDLGAHIPKGVLLVGPPGTGKTLLAKAVAGEAGVQFLSISGSDFVEMYVGVGASRVRDLFEQAKKQSPAIVFIDEIDAVGRQRGTGLGGGHDEREQTLNQLLVEMDGFAANEGVVVLAATNRADVLDPALLRPGRFDRQVYVGLPDIKGREEILKVHAKDKKLDDSVNLRTVARATSGFTGADLSNLLNEAAILAARENRPVLNMEDINEALMKIVAGPAKKSHVQSRRDLKTTAIHEAGHAVAMYRLPSHDPVRQISIVPRGRSLGATWYLPKDDSSNLTRNEMYEQIVGLLGGRVAEALYVGDISVGASNDIDRATKLAKDMVARYGMCEKLGTVSYLDDGEVFIGRDYQNTKSYSEKVAGTIDEEVKALIDQAYDDCKAILEKDGDKLQQVVAYLMEHETMTGAQFADLMEGRELSEASATALTDGYGEEESE